MKFYVALFAAFLFVACGGKDMSSDTELQALEAERMAQQSAHDGMKAAHDRIMPRMGEITATQRAIQHELEHEGLADDRKELLEAAFEELEDAHDGMMEWMQGMKPLDELRETMDNEAIIKYIREESAEIADVETSMNVAMANAKELLGDHAGHSH